MTYISWFSDFALYLEDLVGWLFGLNGHLRQYISGRLPERWGGRVERRCWVNFQCRGVLLVWIIVGQGPIALAVGAGGGLFGHFFSHLSFLFSFSLSLGDGPI